MVQSLSLSALTATATQNGGVSSPPRASRNLTPAMATALRTQASSGGAERASIWKHCVLLKGNPNSLGGRDTSSMGRVRVRVRAGWLFKGAGNGGDRGLDASSEQSESANEDILVFFFQLDLATRVQYALNVEEYEIAQQLRNKLTEVETEVIRQQEVKRGSSSKSEAQDKAISIIRLRAELQSAIENENYPLAAKLRDEIANREAESLAASAKALAHENAQYLFRLGQKARHKNFGYRAVICGMDPVCCESSTWMETARVDKLPRGPNQPFYQVLVDVHEEPNLLVAYVAEDNLLAPVPLDMDRFDHPYASFLFYGMDAAGDFIPIKQLREKFNRPRHEIPIDPNDDDGDEDGDDA